MLLEILDLKELLIREQAIVILPELALIAGAVRGLAGLERLRVDLRQREILPDDAHLVAVGFAQTLERRLDTLAERTLEVLELDEGHGR